MNQVEFSTYWQQREAARIKKYWRDVENLSKALRKVYILQYDEMQKEIAYLYAKFPKVSGKMQRKIQYQAAYIKQVMTNIDPKLTKMFIAQNKEMKILFGNVYQDDFYNAIFGLGKGGMEFAFTPLNSRALAKILSYPWSGAEFSERLWENKDKLLRNLKQTMTQGLVQGQGFPKMTHNLADKMDVSLKQANVLVRTETQYFMNKANIDVYHEAEIEKYEYSAAMEENTCPICAALDGRIFKLSEASVGVNYPPMHPNCRCSTIPFMGQARTGKRSAKIDEEWVQVPEDMTFDQWREKAGIKMLKVK